ncbi:L,D-transpeptidase family protein [Shewanella schlegeliana]|uniref:L,D-transpeptidase family protein n=1 Tax=Shewanella schlegeliana TaxID=190308 RepID=A0ABS1ST87_9GAMM|nr:L,D-transpeptidase family protein [Shewanella schlegeliana]MBL4911761.1 L,D-transpeptidase family protein [Shewanella schlegeliana]MCL1110287.1 L,D-transpeptidase family protein [Shewanella schlegeliana]
MRFIVLSLSLLTLITSSLFSTTSFASAMTSGKADLVVVTKSEASMTLLRQGKVLKKYRIAMGDNPVGHKLTEGDQRTPEGRYLLDFKKSDSAYYRAIRISYPNDEDRLRADALGISPGGQIMIHGENPNSSLSPEEAQMYNWTDGCIAVTNAEMDELWRAIDEGTPIEIWP